MQNQRSGLVWLVMAGFCGLIGFVIVYHYANFERPIIRFAIVIDAGSTQTRSSLFTITLDTPELTRWLDSSALSYNNNEDANTGQDDNYDNEAYSIPLNELLQVRQISSCVNGGPMAGLSSQFEADKLVKKCLKKFTRLIKLLDFEDNDDDSDRELNDSLNERFSSVKKSNNGPSKVQSNSTSTQQDNDSDSDASLLLESSELSKQMDLVNHHVSSVTHYYLGATAGMRALAQLNETRALEKLNWVDRALNKSNSLVEYGSPYLNRGYVSIISGSDEATYGWTSVNFICDKLVARSKADLVFESRRNESNVSESLDTGYSTWQEEHLPDQARKASITHLPESIGTIELGGASAQMAFESFAGDSSLDEPFQRRQLKLFNGRYNLVTRSDLCLGMSQAVLRANYILMRHQFELNKFANLRPLNRSAQSQVYLSEIENPCGQLKARTSLSSMDLNKIFGGACLVPAEADLNSEIFKDFVTRTNLKIVLIGTSNLSQCETLLDNLIDTNKCRNYFKLCPNSTPNGSQEQLQSSKIGMPFVTISGYNHALRAINLTPKNASLSHMSNVARAEGIISEKLGGRSIDYNEFVNETRLLCSTSFDEISSKFPRVNKAYQMVICLQLVYIRKLLTEFYGFNPQIAALDGASGMTNNNGTTAARSNAWSQVKFLLFPPTETQQRQSQHNGKRDIGWALGLLLNATSQQLGKAAISNDLDVVGDGSANVEEEIFFHHGASVKFALRATLLLMLACCLIGMSMLVAGLLWARDNHRTGSAFSNHSSSYVVASTPTVIRREQALVCDINAEQRKLGRCASSQLPGVSGAASASNGSYGSIFETRWSVVHCKAAEPDPQAQVSQPKQQQQ